MSDDTAATIAGMPWKKGLDNWFFRHFDHAANVICEQFLKNSDKLTGKILDIGAGDGITDLGILLRHNPQLLVAIDIVDYAQRLVTVERKPSAVDGDPGELDARARLRSLGDLDGFPLTRSAAEPQLHGRDEIL